MKYNQKRILGKEGENYALKYLENKGFDLLCVNYRSKYGEIDIIGQKDKYIIFVEVKLRRRGSVISGIECVSLKKQERIIKTACIYIQEKNIKMQPRFDVVEVLTDSRNCPVTLKHIENAFSTEGNYAFF